MAQSIIDRDREFYMGEVERIVRDLRECHPAEEPIYQERRSAAIEVVMALARYAAALKLERVKP